jgi:hypothetical protein
MVLIMVTSMFPPEKVTEFLNKYNEIQPKFPLPSSIKLKKVGLRWVRGGLKGVAIYDVEKEKVSEVLSFVYRYEFEFAGIEGYSNEIETFLTFEEMPDMFYKVGRSVSFSFGKKIILVPYLRLFPYIP